MSLQTRSKNGITAKQSGDVNPLAGLRFRSLVRDSCEPTWMAAKGQLTSPDQGFNSVKYPARSELVLRRFQASKLQT